MPSRCLLFPCVDGGVQTSAESLTLNSSHFARSPSSPSCDWLQINNCLVPRTKQQKHSQTSRRTQIHMDARAPSHSQSHPIRATSAGPPCRSKHAILYNTHDDDDDDGDDGQNDDVSAIDGRRSIHQPTNRSTLNGDDVDAALSSRSRAVIEL